MPARSTSKHRRFEATVEDDDAMAQMPPSGSSVAASAVANYEEGDREDASDDDDAPTAVSTSQARRSEQLRQLQAESARAAQRKSKRAGNAKKAAAAAAARSISDGKAASEPTAESAESASPVPLQEVTPASVEERTDASTLYSAVATPSSSSKLDPSLFAQAASAINAGKQTPTRTTFTDNEDLDLDQHAAPRSIEVHRPLVTHAGKKRRLDIETDYKAALATVQQPKERVIGEVTVRQVDGQGRRGTSGEARLDPSTALPSAKSQGFLRDRLFHRRHLSRQGQNLPGGGKRGGKKPEEPLIFDPLLDKKAAKKVKTVTQKKEERRERSRGRSEATAAYMTATRGLLGNGFGFAVSGAPTSLKRMRR